MKVPRILNMFPSSSLKNNIYKSKYITCISNIYNDDDVFEL